MLFLRLIVSFVKIKVNTMLSDQERNAGMKRIRFEQKMYEKDKYIEQTIEYCNKYGGFVEIDSDFCVFAIYDGTEHWIGYATPVDMDWFEQQFQ